MSRPREYIYIVFRLNCAYNISYQLGVYYTLSGAKKRIKKDMNKINPDVLEYTGYYISVYQFKKNIVYDT